MNTNKHLHNVLLRMTEEMKFLLTASLIPQLLLSILIKLLLSLMNVVPFKAPQLFGGFAVVCLFFVCMVVAHGIWNYLCSAGAAAQEVVVGRCANLYDDAIMYVEAVRAVLIYCLVGLATLVIALLWSPAVPFTSLVATAIPTTMTVATSIFWLHTKYGA